MRRRSIEFYCTKTIHFKAKECVPDRLPIPFSHIVPTVSFDVLGFPEVLDVNGPLVVVAVEVGAGLRGLLLPELVELFGEEAGLGGHLDQLFYPDVLSLAQTRHFPVHNLACRLHELGQDQHVCNQVRHIICFPNAKRVLVKEYLLSN